MVSLHAGYFFCVSAIFLLFDFFIEVYAPMSLSAISEKARQIAGSRVSSDFAFSTGWFYGFCKFFHISCRLAAEASGSDRLQIDELHVRLLLFHLLSPL